MLKTSLFNVVKPVASGRQFLVNTRTTAVLDVSKPPLDELGRVLVQSGIDFVLNLDESSKQFLQDNGFLVAADFDEKAWAERIHKVARIGEDAFGLGIALTLACNFRCVYCYEKHINAHISDELCESIDRFVGRNISGRQRFRVAWFGGEPLLLMRPLKELSKRFIARCDSEGVEYSARIATNGYLLSRDIAKTLKDYRTTEVQVTLDGPPNIHDQRRFRKGGLPSFQRILENLEDSVDLFSRTIIRINIDENNRDSIPSLLQDYLYPLRKHVVLGFHEALSPGEVHEMEASTSLPESYWNLEGKLGRLADELGFTVIRGYTLPCTSFCMGYQKNSFMIDPYGHFHRCTKYLGVKEQRYGELSADGGMIVNQGSLQAKWDDWSPFKDSECSSCKELPLCMGGCLLYLETNKKKSSTHRCFAKHNLLESVRRDADLLELSSTMAKGM